MRSNAVFSYHANRSVREGVQARDADAGNQQNTTRGRSSFRSWQKNLPNIAIIAMVIIVALFFMQLSNKAVVQSAGTPSGQLFLREKSVYVDAVHKSFSSPINRNKLTVNAEKIGRDLKKQFPELQTVSISLPVIGTRPTVYIQPSIPKLVLVSKNGMYVLDGDGRALIAGNQVAKLADLGVPVVNDDSGLEIRAGEVALPRSTVAFIQEVVGQIKAKQLSISGLSLPLGTNELHLRTEKAGYIVKFNLHGNAREEAGAYLAAKQHLESQKKMPREYIDVRVENKVYYK
jgi:hypothetical protein